MKYIRLLFTLLLTSTSVFAQQVKEFDHDINYEESRVPAYRLPSLLASADGKVISTAEQWLETRRPQILSLFASHLYGHVPTPPSPIVMEISVEDVDHSFMSEKGIRQEIAFTFSNERGSANMRVLIILPANAQEPVPALMMLNFTHNSSPQMQMDPDSDGMLKNGWPIGDLLDSGYAFISVYQQDLVGHNEVEFSRGIHPLFFEHGQSFPMAYEWGVLSAIGWSAMKTLDYLETREDIDHERIALMGHSKLGKATLWAAAQDERFALAISAQSGCAGAALWRRRSGETLSKMVTRFPYWLARNAWKYVDQEEDLPVDQHMLLALIAPRPVYVASGIEDGWADPRGEYLSAFHASRVYELFDLVGLATQDMPPVDNAIVESHVGYHVRSGGHSLEPYDWSRFLDFMDYHLKR